MIEKNLWFLKIGSRLIKIAAWTFLLVGVISGIATLIAPSENMQRWMGFYLIVIYSFGFLLVYLITFMADLLLEIWQFLKKERL